MLPLRFTLWTVYAIFRNGNYIRDFLEIPPNCIKFLIRNDQWAFV